MRFTTLFFDLDDTLYPSHNGLWDAIRARMARYMAERLRLPESEISTLRRTYYETYGTTLRGLQLHHQVDADDYLAYVHDLPLEQFLQPAPELRKLLLSLPQRKWVFTNADDLHAQRVLAALSLTECFEGIIDLRAMDFACKPELSAFQRALKLAGDPDPQRCVLLDDAVANLVAARRLGFYTVLVHWNGNSHPQVDTCVPNLLALAQRVPELWEQ